MKAQKFYVEKNKAWDPRLTNWNIDRTRWWDFGRETKVRACSSVYANWKRP